MAISPLQLLDGGPSPLARSETALEAEARASAFFADRGIARWLSAPREVERARRIFVNRNLRMAKVDLVGFDMDYTLAIYHLRRIEALSFDMTLERLIARYDYPEACSKLRYDHRFVMRGLVVDRSHGNLVKMDRFGWVGRAHHGLRPLPRAERDRLYRQERIRLERPRWASIDTLFALPEACLYAGIIDALESDGQRVDYGKLYDDIREAIDSVHRDGSLKYELRKDLGHYIFKDPELGPSLHKLRSAGKKLFVLTNSYWEYTDAVMRYLLDGVLAEYPSWRNYFDFIVTGASKPTFFSGALPFLEVNPAQPDQPVPVPVEGRGFERGKIYQGGNLADFERLSGFGGDSVLYVGDHIYADILESKKTSLWRTCMIVQELEEEIRFTGTRGAEIARLAELEVARARLDDGVNHHKALLHALDRRAASTPEETAALEEARRAAKSEIAELRRGLESAAEIADVLEADIEEGFNPYWGLLFKEGNENSRFGEQVERYACLYTSRVSNLLHYSPLQYFRSPRELMPHEQVEGGAEPSDS